MRWITNISLSQLHRKFKHAGAFGIKGNINNRKLAAYKKALIDHIKSTNTKIIKGRYHKENVTHYYNPKTRINIMRDVNGEYKSGWILSDKQVFHLLKNGKIGGGK